jgi:hypothetical protein
MSYVIMIMLACGFACGFACAGVILGVHLYHASY